MKALTIGEVAERVGIRQSAIRYYEDIGLLAPPERTSGWRRFSSDSVNRLKVIRTARELGFTLEEIQLLLDGFSDSTAPPVRWRALASHKLPEIDAAIGRALALRRMLQTGMGCGCVRIEECFLEECAPATGNRQPLPIIAKPPQTGTQ